MKKPEARIARRFWWSSLALASLVWLGLGAGVSPVPSQVGESATASTGRRTAAYVYDRADLSFSDSDAQHLNQLNFSFALIRNGEVSGSHWQGIEAYKAFVAKHPHILPVLSIGGWGADGFSQAASTEDGRTRFVDSALLLMERHGFLGVDIDWEYPGSSVAGIASSPNDRRNFTLLLKALREGLNRLTDADGKPRMLGIAVGASPAHLRNIETSSVAALVDQINLMTYDLHTSGVASHHTALYASEGYPLSVNTAVQSAISAGFPKEKIMIGAAFYGHVFTLKASGSQPVFAPAADSGSRTLTYDRIKSRLSSANAGFDEKAKAPYATDGTTFITYDNAASIRSKGAYAAQKGLMGMMCWEYGGDSSGELLAAMYESLN
ncbi:MAG: glycosyl hydrolase family 18 protein [Clostridiales bacterium]|nr:glycosyl hydrolase family 18 protein [Clostridiales bacterium]